MIRLPRVWEQRLDVLVRQASAGHTGTITKLVELAEDADSALTRKQIDGRAWTRIKFTASSLLINLGAERERRDAAVAGIECAEDALRRDLAPEIAGQLRYNIANGLTVLHEMERAKDLNAEPSQLHGLIAIRDRESLRRVRALFSAVGYSDEPSGVRGRALCNLGNTLSHSARWLEAYQAYVDALEADPSNGNAAGNAAEMLRIRAARGRGLSGHYAAVYDKYREQAQQHRARTVELAGEKVAQRWDALPEAGSAGHQSHDGDPLDEYQQWIKKHRLALTVAVEGLGSDEPRWDSALVESVSVGMGEPDPPRIFTSMNVLKAEYLVVRRLAFDGERSLMESPFAQHEADTGVYSDTLDMSTYGVPSAQLVLAQRATLDLLDKVAVAANDHFRSGLAPRKVAFASYWRGHGGDELREGLPVPDGLASAAVALAELAFDIDPAGLYPEAKTLRNAGTHRLVNVTHGESTGVTELTHSTVDGTELIKATHQSLRVARAAYIYLIDLVQDQQDAIVDDGTRFELPLPIQF